MLRVRQGAGKELRASVCSVLGAKRAFFRHRNFSEPRVSGATEGLTVMG